MRILGNVGLGVAPASCAASPVLVSLAEEGRYALFPSVSICEDIPFINFPAPSKFLVREF